MIPHRASDTDTLWNVVPNSLYLVVQAVRRELLDAETMSWAFFVRSALSFQQGASHNNVCTPWGVVEWTDNREIARSFASVTLMIHFLGKGHFQYFCFDMGLLLALVIHEDDGSRGELMSHRRTGGLVSEGRVWWAQYTDWSPSHSFWWLLQ